MFLLVSGLISTLVCFPHARGDVPRVRSTIWQVILFSPRPWGCSCQQIIMMYSLVVFPTPVGMFHEPRQQDRDARRFPHARGDVPHTTGKSQGAAAFSPRPWGCSFHPTFRSHPISVFPTPVGMFRSSLNRSATASCFPHARGDVPDAERAWHLREEFSPRPWGCSLEDLGFLKSEFVFPTPVGMFRARRSRRGAGTSFPHARGDVPRSRNRPGRRAAFSPRPWGCSVRRVALRRCADVFPTPVGMFRPIQSTPFAGKRFPHARGDVPFAPIYPLIDDMFSPRPWGCSVDLTLFRSFDPVFPTPVGMFRPIQSTPFAGKRFPHARGDVPFAPIYPLIDDMFSPRPWGCSVDLTLFRSFDPVFPTPVGMFRGRRPACWSARCFPHARGDVPIIRPKLEAMGLFSPRPWGCSILRLATVYSNGVFPTPVGMFLAFSYGIPDGTCFPHARGDVPFLAGAGEFTEVFSPRPWGCSARAAHPAHRRRVFPTPVGMFLPGIAAE